MASVRVRSRSGRGRAGIGNRAGRQETVGPNNECPANEKGGELSTESYAISSEAFCERAQSDLERFNNEINGIYYKINYIKVA